MIINRTISSKLKDSLLGEPKVTVLYGPRQAGKTTLINALLQEIQEKSVLSFTGDDLFTQDLFGKNELESLKRAIGNSKILIIDEAQRIPNIGLTLKLILDNLHIPILASGSSSFDLANKINESLTGRTRTFWLYPLAYSEIENQYKQVSPRTSLEQMLRFGMYPKVHTLLTEEEKQNYLYEYLNNYLYKDILSFENVRKPKKVINLLTLLALQVGKEVSVAELAQHLAMSQPTVESYLDVLEKMFILVNLRGFSRNLRKEISKTSKYYFIDAGLRNSLLRNFNSLNLRNDAGELFENWFIIEKYKRASNFNHPANFYFWRTYDQQEIDLIEEREGTLTAYECKWSPNKKISAPKDWRETYKNSEFKLVNQDNYFEYLE